MLFLADTIMDTVMVMEKRKHTIMKRKSMATTTSMVKMHTNMAKRSILMGVMGSTVMTTNTEEITSTITDLKDMNISTTMHSA
jgi:hypothetical protein